MDRPPMILPKGIVFNIDRVYKEVASYPVVPPEKIYEYWHVYTTTFGKLKDPTANRLENFWWHVLGSDRSSLSGPTLARLFEQISNGPTFVPLRGPPNRYEGPSVPSMGNNITTGVTHDKAANRLVSGEDDSRGKAESPKVLASSSSKPPPSHPILKKPRGPSTSGPRPTARFVSPAGSDVEDDIKSSEADSSTSTAGPLAPHAKSANSAGAKERHKKLVAVMPKKKVVASSAKRRPAMPRRQSSQSSATGSEVGSREERPSLSSRYLAAQRSVSPIAEKPSKTASTKPKEEGQLSSAIEADTRRVKVPEVGSGQERSPRATTVRRGPAEARTVAATAEAPKSNTRDKGKEPARRSDGTSEKPPAQPHRSNSAESTQPGTRAVPMAYSKSDTGTARVGTREMKPSARRGVPQGLTSLSTATTSNVAAQGTIIEFDENAPARAVASALQDEMSEGSLRRSGSTATLTPTAPSNTPSVPLGRSKSQLTLLLERQGEKKPRR